jgi:hypothetical protein
VMASSMTTPLGGSTNADSFYKIAMKLSFVLEQATCAFATLMVIIPMVIICVSFGLV